MAPRRDDRLSMTKWRPRSGRMEQRDEQTVSLPLRVEHAGSGWHKYVGIGTRKELRGLCLAGGQAMTW